jgi:hypothetical protein
MSMVSDFGINGGQFAASFDPPTFVMDANLTHDAVPVTSPERVGPSAASTVDLIGTECAIKDPAVMLHYST